MLRLPVHCIKQLLFRSIDWQQKIPVSVTLVDQNGRSFPRQAVLNTDCFRHSNGHIVKPGVTRKTHLLPDAERHFRTQ